jgi:hypothetical protein
VALLLLHSLIRVHELQLASWLLYPPPVFEQQQTFIGSTHVSVQSHHGVYCWLCC